MRRFLADARRSAFAGSVAGGFGGVIGLAVADWMVSHAHFLEHARLALEGTWSPTLRGPMAVRVAVALAAVAGAFLGSFLGRLTRRLSPLGARLVFDGVLVPALCTLLYAFVVQRYAPVIAQAVPFVAVLLGALAYGACVALAPPIRGPRLYMRSY